MTRATFPTACSFRPSTSCKLPRSPPLLCSDSRTYSQDAFASVGLSTTTLDLPQIAVIGSQSSGKSSVLEVSLRLFWDCQ
jgi:hypothetical protein